MLFSETLQRRLLTLCLGISVLMAVLVAALMGAEYDEIWIAASARQAFDAEALTQVRSVTTTGGLYFWIVGLTHGLPVPPLMIPRLLSLLSAIALFYIIARQTALWTKSGIEQRIILVTCLAAPGTMLMAGMGYGILLATTLFIAGMFVALKSEKISPAQAILAGLLIGTAVATRWTLIPALPAILLWACYSGRHLRHNLLMSVLGGVVAVICLGLFVTLQAAVLGGAGGGSGDSVSVSANLMASGAGRELPPVSRMLSFVVRLMTTLPVVLIILAVMAYFTLKQEHQARRLILILIGAGLLITAAWILRSPWMHLRYIWPVYMMIALCAGLGLAALYRLSLEVKRPELGLLAVGLPLCMAAAQMIIALRLIAVGAGMQVNAAGYENIENSFKPFFNIQEQQEIVQFLQSLEPDTVVGTLKIPFEYGANELTFLSNRQVIDYARATEAQAQMQPDFFLVHRFSPLNEAGYAWLDTLGEPARTIKGYTVYTFPDATALPDPEEVTLDNQLYRFTLVKNLSLSGY